MKKEKKQQSPGAKHAAGKKMLKKAAQGAAVLGALNIALSGFAADSLVVEKNSPAAVGKQSNQTTEKERAAAAAAQKKIQDARSLDDGVTGGPCGIAKTMTTPTKR